MKFKFQKYFVILSGLALILVFQNCIGITDTPFTVAAGGTGEGTGFQGTVIPEGRYARRYFHTDQCNKVLSEVESDGKEAYLTSDNCAPVNYKIENYMVDHDAFNPYVFGLGPVIMRTLETGQQSTDAPYDVAYCRYREDYLARDIMIFHSGDPSQLVAKVLLATRDDVKSDYQLVEENSHFVSSAHGSAAADSYHFEFDRDVYHRLSIMTYLPNWKDYSHIKYLVGGYRQSAYDVSDVDCRIESNGSVLDSLTNFYEGRVPNLYDDNGQLFGSDTFSHYAEHWRNDQMLEQKDLIDVPYADVEYCHSLMVNGNPYWQQICADVELPADFYVRDYSGGNY